MAHKITVRVTKIRQRIIQNQADVWRRPCEQCQRQVEALTTEEAAQALQVDFQMLESLIGDGNIHTNLAVDGTLWVCKDSLFFK